MAKVNIKRRSALSEGYQTGRFGDMTGPPGVVFAERCELTIVQVDAWKDKAAEAIATVEQCINIKPSRTPCCAVQTAQTAALWIAPERWLIIEKEQRDVMTVLAQLPTKNLAAITDHSHSRCVLRLSGKQTRQVLRKGTTLDLDDDYFKPNQVKTTKLFHINGLLHCVDEDCFDVYVARSFGQSFFAVISHAAAEYGYQITEPI